MHGEAVEVGGQQYLARQAARAPHAGGEVEHIFFHLARGRQAVEILLGDDDMRRI